MKYQSLISEKNKKNFISFSSAELAQKVVVALDKMLFSI